MDNNDYMDPQDLGPGADPENEDLTKLLDDVRQELDDGEEEYEQPELPGDPEQEPQDTGRMPPQEEFRDQEYRDTFGDDLDRAFGDVPEEPEEETEPVVMPEVTIPVDDTPVVAEEPHVVVLPIQGEVLTAFSVDQLLYNETLDDWRTHDGVDIAAAEGDAVLAACAGTVSSITDDPLMGTTVVIQHSGGYETTYANLQAEPAVETGDTVTAGQAIGAVGTTAAAESAQGAHLHFAVTREGEAVDPQTFLDQ